MENMVIILTSLGSRAEAERMAIGLVTERLAACAQISGPTQSVYRWQGEVKREQECVLTIKALPSKAKQIESYISSQHSYQTPEVLQINAQASSDYLAWAQKESL